MRASSNLSRSAAFHGNLRRFRAPYLVASLKASAYALRHTSSRATTAALRYWQRSDPHRRASAALLPIAFAGVILEIDVGQRLSVSIPYDDTAVEFLDGPGRWKVVGHSANVPHAGVRH